ncbi:hypothetical protein [Streptomyces sp. NPDC046832]|uniref:hypothetical protein n=1 Tax=Streptomyces sp. NPDC046832 TaxID=3155020 RepID=UPI0033CEA90A
MDGSVKDLPSVIRDRNNSDSLPACPRSATTAAGMCVARSGGSIHDLHGYHLNTRPAP